MVTHIDSFNCDCDVAWIDLYSGTGPARSVACRVQWGATTRTDGRSEVDGTTGLASAQALA